mmetsp:Transcript_85068/g.264303  ORF Transcript_85068/g.264303 Transcript_85068/m.264303 type:complete len:466 (-) Transcript_85068:113-1510(-)|eukprot:CAMPEP_0204587320 /NCGR_PEP_ID=MMETSP0661-20131031/47985_1 /ASSEMBLY_ACC=CAM_ASM_000606 /TAXON_ID=109239 /ORGANISM="Alexandrium margalefi, Strain AMGDE01CS-322" /LENGTH=465 /DNA_ID=CAMNT_0051597031 /DNA_START=148 /DNA_END=1545 /DNA_ORIENTATION=+
MASGVRRFLTGCGWLQGARRKASDGTKLGALPPSRGLLRRLFAGRPLHCKPDLRSTRPATGVERVQAETVTQPRGVKRRYGPGASWDGAVPWERSSLMLPKHLPDEDVDDFIEEEIQYFAPMSPRPLTMQEVLDMLEPKRIAKYLHVEVPVRYAERIRWIQDIHNWQEIPELVDVNSAHVQAFREMRLVRRKPDLDEFTAVVQRAVESQQAVRHKLAMGLHRLHHERGEEYGSDFADPWLDKVLLNCIGTETLLSQYLACVRMESGLTGRGRTFSAGIVDPDCDVAQLCRETASQVQELCEEQTGRCPMVKVEVYQERGEARFSYIPGFLRFILTEVLKNACRATVEVGKSDHGVQKRPITVIVCADEHDVAIRVSDRARGIPFEVGQRVWSYLYTTAAKGGGAYGERATSLAGYGVGLPLSRQYARYLGGSLNLVSLPGYGTSVDLFLTRVSADQIELVPDEDS